MDSLLLRTSDPDRHAIRIARSDIFRHLTADDLCACRDVCLRLGAWSCQERGGRWEDSVLASQFSILQTSRVCTFFADISGPQRPQLKSSEVPKRRQRLNCRREYDDGTDKIYDCLLNAAFQFVLFHQKSLPLCSLNLPQTSQAPKKLIVFIFLFFLFFGIRNQTTQSRKKIFGHWTPEKRIVEKRQQLQPRSKQNKKKEP